jgi:hypothetical protein
MKWEVSVTPRPRFTPRERAPGTHCIGGWVSLRAGLDTRGYRKNPLPLSGIDLRVCSQTLYWLRLPQLPFARRGTENNQKMWSLKEYRALVTVYFPLPSLIDSGNLNTAEHLRIVVTWLLRSSHRKCRLTNSLITSAETQMRDCFKIYNAHIW